MATEPTLEPTVVPEQEEEDGSGEESDVYEIEDENEGDAYRPDDDDDDEDDEAVEEAYDVEPENLTAGLLGKVNGTSIREEEEDGEYDEDEEEYRDDEEENPVDLSSAVAGSKRGAGELSEGDADGDEELEENQGETVAKRAKV